MLGLFYSGYCSFAELIGLILLGVVEIYPLNDVVFVSIE